MRDAHLRLLRRLATEPDTWDEPGLGWDPSLLAEEPLDRRPFPEAGPRLDDPLRAAARAMPGEPAVLDSSGGLSHGELAERTGRIGVPWPRWAPGRVSWSPSPSTRASSR